MSPIEEGVVQQHVPPSTDTFVRSFAKGLAVIRSFSREAPRQTLSEVAVRTGLTRAGARRILLTLQSLGYVEAEGRRFVLTPRVLELGFSYIESQPVWHAAQVPIRDVMVEHGFSCALSVLDGNSIIFLARTLSGDDPRVMFSPGGRCPAIHTASGQALLAALPAGELETVLLTLTYDASTPYSLKSSAELTDAIASVRRNGYAFSNQQLKLGTMAIARTVRDPAGRATASISIPVKVADYRAEDFLARAVPVLFNTVDRIEAVLSPM